MKRTIELDQDDIRQAIATAYNVQPKDVRMDLFMDTVGYGMNEREVPAVRATIEVNPSVRI